MTQHGYCFRIMQDYPTGSLPLNIEKLCEIEIKKRTRKDISKQGCTTLRKATLKPIKKAVIETLFKNRTAVNCFPGDLLHSDGWTLQDVVSAVAFRLRRNQRCYYDANRLEDLSRQVLTANPENEQVLKFLISLSDVDNRVPCRHNRFQVPTSDDIKTVVRRKCPLTHGDFPFFVYNPSYTIPDFGKHPAAGDSIMYLEAPHGNRSDLLHASRYSDPELNTTKKGTGIFGFQSKFFSHQSLTDSAYEIDSQTRLYGGLRHSRTFELDIRMSYPKLNSPIDLLASVSTPTDEGFVSPSSSFNFSDSELEEPESKVKQNILVPYFDYKVPRHDLNLWRDCLSHEMLRHYTWEALGLPAGCTPRRLYVTEAGSKIFDEIWKQRCLLIHHLSDFYIDSSLSKVTWLEFDEREFVKSAALVMMGVPSKIFQFNALGQLFLPCPHVYFSGVDSAALRSLLLQFCRWGTSYRRLLRFSISGGSELPFKSVLADRGAVFKAFVGALRLHLHGYLNRLLSLEHKDMMLLALSKTMQNPGGQIEYIARFCQCGNPDLPSPSSIPAKDFPTGVRLLSYLYEEVVHQPHSSHHLILLFLLKRSCAPYLQFIKDWVFRGQCWDVHGEFMLKVNVNYGARHDRLRWLKYVEPAHPDNPGSCVPAFLVSIASDIYTCGKTVSLMQTISPSHLLVVEGADSPRLEISFSKRKFRHTENNWSRHQLKMAEIETKWSLHWSLVEERRKAEAHRATVAARNAAHDVLLKMQEALQLERQRTVEAKGKELERLKKQAEDEMMKRVRARQTEQEEDLKREQERQRSEQMQETVKNKLLHEEKEKIVSYYEELNQAADRRIRKANWSKRRNRLHHERMKFLTQDEKFWQNQIHGGEVTRPASDLEMALQDIGSDLQFIPEGQPRVKLNRKGVHGAHVSQTTLNFDPDIRSLRKTVDGRHVSATSDDVFASPDAIGHVKKSVAGKSVSASSIGDLMDFSGNSEPSTERTLKKPVAGQSVSDSSVGDLFKYDGIVEGAQPGVVMAKATGVAEFSRPLRKSVPGRGVSGSSIANPLVDLSPPPRDTRTKTFKKAVPGRNVSASSVAELMHSSPAPNVPSGQCNVDGVPKATRYNIQHSQETPDTIKTSIKIVPGQNVSTEAVGSLLQPHLKHDVHFEMNEFHRKKKSVQNISTSSIQDCMKLEPGVQDVVSNIARLEKFGQMNRIHGKHHSQSTIEDLVYYDGTMPWTEKASMPMVAHLMKEPVNSSRRHPSFSTIQLLMYRESAEIVEDVRDVAEGTFHLQLPSAHTYLAPQSATLLNSVEDEKFGRPVDLMRNFPTVSDPDEEDELFTSDAESTHTEQLPALLRRCIIHPISRQIALTNRCALNYFMTDLKLLRHFEMMRHFCFMEDGEFGELLSSKLFERMRGGCKPSDLLNPVVLDSLISQAVQGSSQRNSEDAKRLTFSLMNIPEVFSSQDPESLDCFCLKYDIGWPHNIVITEANHTKYGQVFGFLLQLKRVMWSLNDVTKKLSSSSGRWKHLSGSELRRLHIYRHEMHNFMRVMQGYVSTQVVHVSWHEFLQDLKSTNCLEDLHSCHVEYLRKCVFRCLLTKKTKMVMSVITDIFKTILRFWSQLFSRDVKFTELNVTYANFKKYSGFLFKVVSKLVKLGYQPSLEDFLLRLNFNSVYGE